MSEESKCQDSCEHKIIFMSNLGGRTHCFRRMMELSSWGIAKEQIISNLHTGTVRAWSSRRLSVARYETSRSRFKWNLGCDTFTAFWYSWIWKKFLRCVGAAAEQLQNSHSKGWQSEKISRTDLRFSDKIAGCNTVVATPGNGDSG